MDLAKTYKTFLIKTLREKRYHWARNTFFVLFPLLFIITYIFSGATDDVKPIHAYQNDNKNAFPTILQVNIHTLHCGLHAY